METQDLRFIDAETDDARHELDGCPEHANSQYEFRANPVIAHQAPVRAQCQQHAREYLRRWTLGRRPRSPR